LADLTSVSAITGLTFRNTFWTYYNARTNLLNIIATTTKTVADNANTAAAAAQIQANTETWRYANKVIEKLGDQIRQMSASIAIKDVQIETLQQELTKLNVDK